MSDNSDHSSECSHSGSCSSESDDVLPPWIYYVMPDGNLFYIEEEENPDELTKNPCIDLNLKQCDSSNKHTEPKSIFKAAGKFRQWVKNRKNKVCKSLPLLKSDRSEAHLKQSYVHQPSQLYVRDVFIDTESPNSSGSDGLLFSYNLLGLILGPFNDQQIQILDISNKYTALPIQIGDLLKSINDIDVNISTIDDVLRNLSIPSKVKLTIVSQTYPTNKLIHTLIKHENLFKLVCEDAIAMEQITQKIQHIPYGLYFISSENVSAEQESVIFKFPKENTPLLNLKGMFLTLGYVTSHFASPPLLSCSVVVQNELVHVGYVKENEAMMILALPAKVATVSEVQHFTTCIAKVFRFLYSSLHEAFTAHGEENTKDLIAFFEHYLYSSVHSSNEISESHLLDILLSVFWLPLPHELRTEIDDILSELESSDFGGGSKGFYEGRRIFNIYGSCLYYKGYLLASHLPKSDLLDINLYLHHTHLLELTQAQPVLKIIIWYKVFPSRRQVCSSECDPKFEEAQGEWFMLIVIMNHSILAVLLDNSGCALKCEDPDDYVAPDAFYIDEVQNTHFILQNCGIYSAVEKILNHPVLPVVSPDEAIKNVKSRGSLFSIFSPSNPSNLVESQSSSQTNLLDEKSGLETSKSSSLDKLSSIEQQLLSSMGPADGESDTDSNYSASYQSERQRRCSYSTASTTESQNSAKSSYSPNSHQSSSLPNLNATSSSENLYKRSVRMVTNFGNNLFHYLHMDPVEGIFIAPVPNKYAIEPVKDEIIINFLKCCSSMRTLFERSLRNEEISKANIVPNYGVNTSLKGAYEQGIMFEYSHPDSSKKKGNQQKLCFWVVGRLFFSPEPREVYICYHDTIPQDITEMAFHLGFGLSF